MYLRLKRRNHATCCKRENKTHLHGKWKLSLQFESVLMLIEFHLNNIILLYRWKKNHGVVVLITAISFSLCHHQSYNDFLKHKQNHILQFLTILYITNIFVILSKLTCPAHWFAISWFSCLQVHRCNDLIIYDVWFILAISKIYPWCKVLLKTAKYDYVCFKKL